MHQELPHDEIDLRDLIRALWQGKWLVIVCTLAIVLLGVAYRLWVPQTYKASLSVYPIDSFTVSRYAPLAATEMLAVDEHKLALFFFEDFHQALPNVMSDLGYVTREANESDNEYLIRLGAVAANYKLVAPGAEGTVATHHWQISYTTKQPMLSRQVIEAVLDQLNTSLQQQLQDHFAVNLSYEQLRLDNQLIDITLKINALTAVYEARTSMQIAMLKEQSAIARQLGLDSNQMINSLSNNKDLLVLGNTDLPLYMNGYIALEREIELLAQRQDPATFIPEFAALQGKKYTLENDTTISRAQKSFAQTPLSGSDFEAVRYDLAALEMQPKLKALLLLVLSIVFGGILGLIVLMVRNTLPQKS